MLCLQSHTQDAWLQRAIAHTDDVLIDHAHCERKAASNALNLLGRFPDHPELQEPMLALARCPGPIKPKPLASPQASRAGQASPSAHTACLPHRWARAWRSAGALAAASMRRRGKWAAPRMHPQLAILLYC